MNVLLTCNFVLHLACVCYIHYSTCTEKEKSGHWNSYPKANIATQVAAHPQTSQEEDALLLSSPPSSPSSNKKFLIVCLFFLFLFFLRPFLYLIIDLKFSLKY